jgi:hypothetical protein
MSTSMNAFDSIHGMLASAVLAVSSVGGGAVFCATGVSTQNSVGGWCAFDWLEAAAASSTEVAAVAFALWLALVAISAVAKHDAIDRARLVDVV